MTSRRRLLRERLQPVVRLLGRHRWLLRVSIAAGAFSRAVIILAASYGAWLVARVVTGTPITELWGHVALLAGLIATGRILWFVDDHAAHTMSWRTLADTRIMLFEHLERLAPAYQLSHRSGDLARTALSDVQEIESYTSHVLPRTMSASAVPATAIVVLAVLHPLLALSAAPFMVLVASVPFWLSDRAEKQGDQMRRSAGELAAASTDAVQGLRDTLAFGAETIVAARLAGTNRALGDATVRHGRRLGLERASTGALLSLAVIAVAATGSALVASGRLAPQLYPPALVLTIASFAPILELANVRFRLHSVASSAERVLAILDQPPTVTDQPGARTVPDLGRTVRFHDVRFRYQPELDDVLRGISFTIEPGQTVALVGESGAGKTTTANLLLRMFDPTSGTITIDGHDIATVPLRQLRQHIGYVPQDTYLFNGTVRDNLLIARPDATDSDLRHAAKRAIAEEFIEALPDGWDTQLGERGNTLSGGQRQRLAVARALLKDAPILVLDEPSSHLDTESEAHLHAALTEAAAGRTTLLIAHRPSTIATADRVLVMRDGTIVEDGDARTLGGPGTHLSALLRSNTSSATTVHGTTSAEGPPTDERAAP